MEGREAVHVLQIDVNALLEEPTDEIEMADGARGVEQRLLVTVKHVEVASTALVEQSFEL